MAKKFSKFYIIMEDFNRAWNRTIKALGMNRETFTMRIFDHGKSEDQFESHQLDWEFLITVKR